jgi:hypothetical protein
MDRAEKPNSGRVVPNKELKLPNKGWDIINYFISVVLK